MTLPHAGTSDRLLAHLFRPSSAGVTEDGRLRAQVLCVIACMVIAATAHAYVPEAVHSSGTLRGRVTLVGAAHIDMMPITKDPSHCGGTRPSPRLVVGKNHGVKNAVVRIENISSGKPFSHVVHPTLEQRHCEYVPHVMAVPVGTQLEILNSDAILHNVHA